MDACRKNQASEEQLGPAPQRKPSGGSSMICPPCRGLEQVTYQPSPISYHKRPPRATVNSPKMRRGMGNAQMFGPGRACGHNWTFRGLRKVFPAPSVFLSMTRRLDAASAALGRNATVVGHAARGDDAARCRFYGAMHSAWRVDCPGGQVRSMSDAARFCWYPEPAVVRANVGQAEIDRLHP